MIGALCMLCYCIVTFFGLQSLSLYRSIQVVSLSFMYIYILGMFSLKPIYHAFKKNEKYNKVFLNSIYVKDLSTYLEDPSLLYNDEEILLDFLLYCKDKGAIKKEIAYYDDLKIVDTLRKRQQQQQQNGGGGTKLSKDDEQLNVMYPIIERFKNMDFIVTKASSIAQVCFFLFKITYYIKFQ